MGRLDHDGKHATAAIRRVYPLLALLVSTVFCLTVALAAWVYRSEQPAVDFASFWAAGRLAALGTPALAYAIEAHRAVEMTVAHMGGLMPFPYPPPFLFFVAPVAFEPFWLAYLAWIVPTAALYVAALSRFMAPRYPLAHPAALVNAMIGQNGLLTTAIFGFGITMVATQPLLGGSILGLLIVKPQLGVLLPVALLAERNWRAIAGAAASSLLLLAVAWVVFGSAAYRGFFEITGEYAGFMAASRWNWGEFASLFALLRFFGLAQPIALAVQSIAAILAAAVTWRAWSRRDENRIAILAAATLLVTPYLLTYDSLLLVLPLAVVLRDEAHPWRPAILWLLLLAPFLGYFGLYPGPNTIPAAAILSLWWLARPERRGAITPDPASAQ
jgi:hypothetical protein